jgi:uncharacterized protein (TIGR02271 family)
MNKHTEAAPSADANAADPHDEARLRLYDEQLHVEKQPEQAGVVRLSRRTVDRVEKLEVPVQEERLVIEKRHGGGRVFIEGRELQDGESVEITLKTERVLVSKEPVASDVRIHKETVQVSEHVEATLRRDVLDVDDPLHAVEDRSADAAQSPAPTAQRQRKA